MPKKAHFHGHFQLPKYRQDCAAYLSTSYLIKKIDLCCLIFKIRNWIILFLCFWQIRTSTQATISVPVVSISTWQPRVGRHAFSATVHWLTRNHFSIACFTHQCSCSKQKSVRDRKTCSFLQKKKKKMNHVTIGILLSQDPAKPDFMIKWFFFLEKKNAFDKEMISVRESNTLSMHPTPTQKLCLVIDDTEVTTFSKAFIDNRSQITPVSRKCDCTVWGTSSLS